MGTTDGDGSRPDRHEATATADDVAADGGSERVATDGGSERVATDGVATDDGSGRVATDGGSGSVAADLDAGLPDLEEVGSRRRIGPRTAAFLLSVLGLVGAFVYDYRILEARESIVFGWDLALHEWLFVLSLLVFVFYVVVPLAANRRLTMTYWRRLRGRPVGLLSFLYLVAFFLVGMVGPEVVGAPSVMSFNPPYQPPVGVGIKEVFISACQGSVSGGKCYGSMAFPLGTDGNGRDVVVQVVNGIRVAIEVAFVSGTLIVPVATVVGTVAAEFGGRVDDLLMRTVDLTQVVPAFFVYIVAQYVYEPRLTLLLVVFGLLSWGSIARVVRSEAAAETESDYARAARNAGASRLWIVRRHVVPNVANTVISAVTLLIPTLILVEAALSYLALGDPTANSLGFVISAGLNQQEFPQYWWISTVPAVVLIVTVVALNLFGDALRDVLDPRMDQ